MRHRKKNDNFQLSRCDGDNKPQAHRALFGWWLDEMELKKWNWVDSVIYFVFVSFYIQF